MDGTAIIANNPRAVGFSFKLGSNEHNFALGHVAVAFQKYDGTFIFSSIESGSSFWGIPLPAGRVNKDKIGLHFNTFDDLKEYMCTNEYTTYKIIPVDNFNPAMALDVTGSIKDPGDLGQPSTFYNVLGSLTKPITDRVRQLMGIVLDPLVGFFDEDSPKSYARVGDVPNDENCLTSSIKILNAYGADMPYISALLSTPNAYYIALPYETHYIDSLDDNIAILQSPEIADNSPPLVQSFQVTPVSVTIGEYFTIDYAVSDNDGSGLKQVELWRMDEQNDWKEIDRDNLAGENGPAYGAFTDSPSSPGTYWYGVHVVDNTGNWNDQSNSNTNYQPISFEPAEVDVNVADASEWTDKGDALYYQGQYDEAIEAYDEAIRLNPYFAEAWTGKGYVLVVLGRCSEGLQICERAIELDPNFATAWINKANALVCLGRYDEALRSSEKAIELDPNSANAWGCKGAALYGLARYDESLQASEKALELDPNLGAAWNNKGDALYNLDRYDECLQACEESIRLDPSHATTWATKGHALRRLGRTAESKEAFSKAKDLGYQSPWLSLYL
jgi:tetratricopeptide (TPR) repeat protein